jgi:hypothetical protein
MNNQCVPPLGTFRVIMEKYTKLLGIENFTFNDYFKLINTQLDIFGYQYRQHIEVSPDLRNIRITFEGENTEHLKGVVVNYSCLLSHNPIKLKIKKFMESPNLIIVDYEPCSSEEEAFKSVMDQFGYNQFILDEIQSKIKFWRSAINILKADHYEDVIISRSILLQIAKSREFSDQLCNLISVIYSVPVEGTDYKVLVRFIEEIYKTNGLVHKIEHIDNEIRLYHAFEDKEIIHIINDTVIKTLEKSGQTFELRKGDKMTILNRKERIQLEMSLESSI